MFTALFCNVYKHLTMSWGSSPSIGSILVSNKRLVTMCAVSNVNRGGNLLTNKNCSAFQNNNISPISWGPRGYFSLVSGCWFKAVYIFGGSSVDGLQSTCVWYKGWQWWHVLNILLLYLLIVLNVAYKHLYEITLIFMQFTIPPFQIALVFAGHIRQIPFILWGDCINITVWVNAVAQPFSMCANTLTAFSVATLGNTMSQSRVFISIYLVVRAYWKPVMSKYDVAVIINYFLLRTDCLLTCLKGLG